MAYLFLDTTDHLIVGLLSEKFEWLAYHEFEERRSSAIIHGKIHELLEECGLEISSLKSIIQVAGPGSYTGMRVSDGISQVFDMTGISCLSYHHFEVPAFFEVGKYVWLSTAFKGEFFLSVHDSGAHTKQLVADKDISGCLESYVSGGFKIYTHFSNSLELNQNISSTAELVKENPASFFRNIVESSHVVETFYYRSLEEEFKVSKK